MDGITVGMLMHYGGAAGVVLGIIIMLVLSKVFANQRQRKKETIGGNQNI